MAGYTTGPLTITAGEALEANRLVKASTGTAVYADAADTEFLGVTLTKVASGDAVAIMPWNSAGTIDVTAAGTFAVSAALYLANDGKVDDSGTTKIGVAWQAATTAGDIVPMQMAPPMESTLGQIIPLTAGENVVAGRLVKLSTGKVIYADAAEADDIIGVTMAAASANAAVDVAIIGELRYCEAADAFAAGAPVYLVNDGKVDDAGTTLIGIALDAAAAAAAQVRVVLNPFGQLVGHTHT